MTTPRSTQRFGIISGPSHSGKSTAARFLALASAVRSVNLVEMDDIIERALGADLRDLPAVIDQAYRLGYESIQASLTAGQCTLFISTFTYVPLSSDTAELHLDWLDLFVRAGHERGIETKCVRIMWPKEIVMSRALLTDRLDSRTVAAIYEAHIATPESSFHRANHDIWEPGQPKIVATALGWI